MTDIHVRKPTFRTFGSSKCRFSSAYGLSIFSAARQPIIGGDRNWIDQHYEIRNDVAHGIESVNVEKVGLVADKTVALRQVAHRFLGDWRKDLLDVDRHPPSESLLEGDGESQAN